MKKQSGYRWEWHTETTSIIDYNHNICGVDFVDQELDSLDVLWKCTNGTKVLSEAGYAMCIGFLQMVQETRREGWFPFLSLRCLHLTSSEYTKIGKKSIQSSHR